MTIQYGDTGKVTYGTLKKFTLTPATPRETLNGIPTSLPIAEPGTAQISFTVQSSDLPTISPAPISLKYTAILYAAGKNTDAASQTVSYRLLKNSISVTSGASSSVVTNNFYTLSFYQLFDVSIGDVLEIKLWSASANVNFDYFALVILPTRVNVGSSYLNKDVVYGSTTTATLTQGTPSVVSATSPYIYPTASTTLNILIPSAGITVNAMHWNSTYNAFQVYYGDNQTGVIGASSATIRPSYRGGVLPSSISFREILR